MRFAAKMAGLVAGMLLLGAGVAVVLQPAPPRGPAFSRADGPRVVWTFEPRERGAIISTPLVTPPSVYVAAIQDHGLTSSGAVYCLDRQTREVRWKFTDDGDLQHLYSSPCLADGRLYFGEGMHANVVCKLYCLEAATGRKLWHFVTAGHIESSPWVSAGRVYFCSGDDGVYCLEAASGRQLWHFVAALHLDSNPAVVGDRVLVGSGVSRKYRDTQALCLEAATGQVIWRMPMPLPAWGSPAVDGERVFFGLGNGRLLCSADSPAGAVVCLDLASGRRLWEYAVPDAVLMQPVVANGQVLFGSRDGHCYSVDRDDGRLRWKQAVGGPVVTRPAVCEERLYVVAADGQVACLTVDGQRLWTFDVGAHGQARPQVFSSPVVLKEGERRRLYFGTELQGPASSAAVLYCLED